jgi:hypothetical protein
MRTMKKRIADRLIGRRSHCSDYMPWQHCAIIGSRLHVLIQRNRTIVHSIVGWSKFDEKPGCWRVRLRRPGSIRSAQRDP